MESESQICISSSNIWKDWINKIKNKPLSVQYKQYSLSKNWWNWSNRKTYSKLEQKVEKMVEKYKKKKTEHPQQHQRQQPLLGQLGLSSVPPVVADDWVSVPDEHIGHLGVRGWHLVEPGLRGPNSHGHRYRDVRSGIEEAWLPGSGNHDRESLLVSGLSRSRNGWLRTGFALGHWVAIHSHYVS